MKKEFVPYDLALELKELGFNNEICFGWWTNYPDGEGYLDTSKKYINQGIDDLNRQCLAPFWQQAFNFFREEYNIDSMIIKSFSMNNSYYYSILIDDDYDNVLQCESISNRTYEEVRLACLEKLIKIVKKEKL